jgi:hypothetical protein
MIVARHEVPSPGMKCLVRKASRLTIQARQRTMLYSHLEAPFGTRHAK